MAPGGFFCAPIPPPLPSAIAMDDVAFRDGCTAPTVGQWHPAFSIEEAKLPYPP